MKKIRKPNSTEDPIKRNMRLSEGMDRDNDNDYEENEFSYSMKKKIGNNQMNQEMNNSSKDNQMPEGQASEMNYNKNVKNDSKDRNLNSYDDPNLERTLNKLKQVNDRLFSQKYESSKTPKIVNARDRGRQLENRYGRSDKSNSKDRFNSRSMSPQEINELVDRLHNHPGCLVHTYDYFYGNIGNK